MEPLRAANSLSRTHLYAWRFLTLDGQSVQSSSGLQIAPHDALSAGSGDLLIVMPSYGVRALDGRDTVMQIRLAAQRYGTIAGFDTGSWLLARAGLLEGYQATIHWDELASFEETFPNCEALRERYVIDGARITCTGAMAAFDVVMHLIGRDHGALLTVDVARLFMTNEAARSYSLARKSSGRMVDRALHLMQENLEQTLSISELARKVGASQRALELRMRDELQETPMAVYRRLRLTYARKLVTETDQSVTEISNRCGYENASAMTRAFKALFGQTPRALRQIR
ncbi:GlxA family transcriptional regulator [Cognatishimia sp. WU-CL00825]